MPVGAVPTRIDIAESSDVESEHAVVEGGFNACEENAELLAQLRVKLTVFSDMLGQLGRAAKIA